MENPVKQVIKLIPFLILCIQIAYCWYDLLTVEDSFITIKYYLALSLLIINIGIYFWKFEKGLIITGIILLLSTFSLIYITFEVATNSFYIQFGSLKISTPDIHGFSLLLLIGYCIVNYDIIKMFRAKLALLLKKI